MFRHHALILLSYFRVLSLYPQISPQIGKRKRGKERKFRKSFWIFFFVFNQLGPVHTALPPNWGGGMASAFTSHITMNIVPYFAPGPLMACFRKPPPLPCLPFGGS